MRRGLKRAKEQGQQVDLRLLCKVRHILFSRCVFVCVCGGGFFFFLNAVVKYYRFTLVLSHT